MCAGARAYARRKKSPRDVLLRASCLTIRGEHRLGTVLSRMELAKGRPIQSQAGTRPKFLKELKLTKQQSHRAQLLATIPKQALDRWLAERLADGKEPTLAAAREYALDLAGKRRRMNRRRLDPATPVDRLGEILEHQRMLAHLLSPVREGGTVEFKPFEGRLLWRILKEIEDLARQDSE
jgi:hypothetical protein